MTDAHYTFHPLTQRARTLGNRSRHAPLTPSRDARPSPWAPLIKVAFVSFMLGAILYAALVIL